MTAGKTSFLNGFVKPLVVRVGLPLLILTIVHHYVDQKLVELTQDELSAENGAGAMLAVYGGLSMLTSILGPVFSMMMIFFAVRAPQTETLLHYIGKNLSWLFKEQLRAMGNALLWGYVFLIPCFWKFLQYTLLPFVVCLEPAYQRGELDALETCRKVFYRIWGRLLTVIIVYFAVIIALTAIDEYRSFTEHPLTAVFMVIVDLSLFVLLQWVLLRFWEQAFERPLKT